MPATIGSGRALLARRAKYDYCLSSLVASSGNGRSPSSPFATVAELVAAVSGGRSGLRIGVERGSTWPEQMTLTGSDILVEEYGYSSNAPFFDCLDLIDPASITKVGGLNITYRATVALPGNPSFLGNVEFDSTMAVQRASSALVDANAGSAYAVDWTAVSTTLDFSLPDGSDPRLGIVAVRYTRRSNAISITGNNNAVRGIRARGNGHSAGMIYLVGQNQLVESCRLEDCSRHAVYFGAGSRVRKNYFYRGRNDIEGAWNSVVWNQSLITSGQLYSEGNIYDAGGLPLGSALLAHDDTAGHLAQSLTSDGDTVKNAMGMGGNTALTTINDPVFVDAGGIAAPNTGVTVINNMSGNIADAARIADMTVGGTLTISGSLTAAQVGDGLVRSTSTAEDFNLTFTNFALTVTDYGASNFKLIKIARGNFVQNGCTYGPTLGARVIDWFEVGIGATGTITGNNNTFAYGTNFKLNGTEYRNLADWTAASGQDAASGYGAITTSFTDNFNRANGNLSVGDSWTLLAGAAGAGQVQSNMVRSTTGLGTGAFGTPGMGTIDHYAKATSKTTATSGKIPISCRVTDSANYVGSSWGGGAYQLTKVVNNSGVQVGASSGITPASDDEVVVAMKGDYGTVYVNKKRAIGPLACSLSGALTSQRAGMPLGSAAVDPLLDDFSCGPLT